MNVVVIAVDVDETVDVSFGDIAAEDITFQEINLGDTERALSINAIDFGEDSRSDMDIILGTHFVGGTNDLLVWWNERKNSTTPNASIFDYSPTYQRLIDADVNSTAIVDLTADGRGDVITGLGSLSNNIAVWLTDPSGGDKGELENVPDARYSTANSSVVLGCGNREL